MSIEIHFDSEFTQRNDGYVAIYKTIHNVWKCILKANSKEKKCGKDIVLKNHTGLIQYRQAS